MAYHRQYKTAAEGGNNLWNTDCTIEESQVSTHVAIALQCIGDKGKRHSQHGSPRTANEQEGDELQVLIMQEGYHGKTDGTNHQTDGVCQFGILKLRQYGSPDNRAHVV